MGSVEHLSLKETQDPVATFCVPLTRIALLGRRDMPTDACWISCCLAQAMEVGGVHLEVVEERWDIHGWVRLALP